MPDLQAEGAFEPNGDTIKLRGEAKTLAALQLLGFHQLLDIPPTSTNANLQPAKAHTVGILPLSPIATEEQQLQAVDAICTIALTAIDNAAAETLGLPRRQWVLGALKRPINTDHVDHQISGLGFTGIV